MIHRRRQRVQSVERKRNVIPGILQLIGERRYSAGVVGSDDDLTWYSVNGLAKL